MKYLGEYVDIHCGGIDNVFPHHTNEIAQSEAYLGHPWCRWWFHVLHLNTQGGKMSKSKGGFLTLQKLCDEGKTPMEYRFFCLGSHYRHSLVYSEDTFENAANAYRKLKSRTLAVAEEGTVDAEGFARYKQAFCAAMDDDLNTAQAITCLYDVLKAKDLNGATKRALFADFDRVLSLDLLKEEKKEVAGGLSDGEIEEQIAARAAAKKAKNYAEADRIRAELAAQGILLTDTPAGTTFTPQVRFFGRTKIGINGNRNKQTAFAWNCRGPCAAVARKGRGRKKGRPLSADGPLRCHFVQRTTLWRVNTMSPHVIGESFGDAHGHIVIAGRGIGRAGRN